MNSRYEESGVSIEKGEELVRRLRADNPLLGGFAGLFPLGDGPDDQVLVACTDGIGTKIELGLRTGQIKGLGQDLVAMCVNDLVVTGARPLFFLDYYATSKLDVDAAELFISGIRDALRACDTLLLGGETAEMPGFYPHGHFDAAGFAVGIVQRSRIIDGRSIKAGDVVAALPSSGLHSNGYSLVRKLVSEGLVDLQSQAPGEPKGITWGQVLLRPTHLYVTAARKATAAGIVKGMAHITGGGIENIDRILPAGLQASIDTSALRPAPFMTELVTRAKMSSSEALRVWNMGTGFVFVVSQQDLASLQTLLPDVFVIGRVAAHP